MVNKCSRFADFVRFHPHTYACTQQSLQPLWTAIKRKTFFLKNHTQNVGEKLFPDTSLKFYTICFSCMPT